MSAQAAIFRSGVLTGCFPHGRVIGAQRVRSHGLTTRSEGMRDPENRRQERFDARAGLACRGLGAMAR